MTGAYQPGESWPAVVIEDHADETGKAHSRGTSRDGHAPPDGPKDDPAIWTDRVRRLWGAFREEK